MQVAMKSSYTCYIDIGASRKIRFFFPSSDRMTAAAIMARRHQNFWKRAGHRGTELLHAEELNKKDWTVARVYKHDVHSSL